MRYRSLFRGHSVKFKFPAHFSSKLAEECKHNNDREEEKRRSMCKTLRICCLLVKQQVISKIIERTEELNSLQTESSIYCQSSTRTSRMDLLPSYLFRISQSLYRNRVNRRLCLSGTKLSPNFDRE